jgi:hypothetical protein
MEPNRQQIHWGYFRMKNHMIAATLLLCACTPAGPFSSAPTHRLSIDGQMWQVQQMPAGKDTWAANKEDPWGGWLDPRDYQRNVRAIEQVSGCKVVRETISNQGMNTTAAVSCPR